MSYMDRTFCPPNFADGFESVDDFWKFFVEHYGSQPIEMVVIRWADFKEEKDERR